jgi:hypothetical protein
MADDPLGNLKLPYDYSKGDPDAVAPSALAALTVQTQASPSPAPTISHPDLDKIPVPYGQRDQPDAPSTKSAPPGPSWTHAIWNSITGEDQPLVVLQPRSLGQAGSDVADFGRVFGNRAIVPNTLDRAISMFPAAGDLAYQQAQTAKARENIGPVASGVADFMGQRASLARNAGPITQGVVTGAGGTVMGGDYNPVHVAGNAAIDVGLNKTGQALGTFGAGAAKWADRTWRRSLSSWPRGWRSNT